MMTRDPDNAALRDYLDALLQEPALQAAGAAQRDPQTLWQSCRLGHLQLLLPGNAVGTPIDASDDTASTARHLAQIRIGTEDWRVLELARCIAPNLAGAATDTLLPVAGSRWLLAVSGRPVPMHLPNDAIEWRAQRSSRPWLAGMSRDGRHMALDVGALIAHVTGNADTTQEEPSP
ncbi:MAG TPA: hypothetical protein VFP92_10095 [Rhodanobacteraceae bacterium]|nr:hypothetical protein [Oleiagrimonas sp.]HET9819502.1 hypothetical protein [Rhodanobacteraceae bacterium]